MLAKIGHFLVLLWSLVGLLLVILLMAELGIDFWRKLSRRLRYGRTEGPDIAALSDANAGADWAVGYFDEYRRHARMDWKAYVQWWQRPFAGRYMSIDARWPL